MAVRIHGGAIEREVPNSCYRSDLGYTLRQDAVTSAVCFAVSPRLDTCPAPLDFEGRCQRTRKTDRGLLGIMSDDAESCPGLRAVRKWVVFKGLSSSWLCRTRARNH